MICLFTKVVASIWLVPKVELMGTVSRPIHDLREPGKMVVNFNAVKAGKFIRDAFMSISY